jgi:hypothetical protein
MAALTSPSMSRAPRAPRFFIARRGKRQWNITLHAQLHGRLGAVRAARVSSYHWGLINDTDEPTASHRLVCGRGGDAEDDAGTRGRTQQRAKGMACNNPSLTVRAFLNVL